MVELITGTGADNHISSNDFRAFNRSVFGQGNYILKDAKNMKVTVSPLTGNITIAEGSCLWSGMHIRVPTQENLSYVVPVSEVFVCVYLHYTKDINSGVENVEFVVSVGEELSPQIDTLEDNTIEAYTLFYDFLASPSAVRNGTDRFVLLESHEELKSRAERMHSETVLFEGSAALYSSFSLSESYKNFYELIFYCGAIETGTYVKTTARVLTSDIPESPNSFGLPAMAVAKWSNSNDTYFKFASLLLTVNSDQKFTYTAGYGVQMGNAIATQDAYVVRKVVGIGRKP